MYTVKYKRAGVRFATLAETQTSDRMEAIRMAVMGKANGLQASITWRAK